MKTRYKLALSTVALVALTSLSVMAQDEQRTAGPTAVATGIASATYKALNLFGDVFELVRANYVEKVEDKKLIEYALNGMLSSLDPHSGYMDEEEAKAMNIQNKGEFGGLGIEV